MQPADGGYRGRGDACLGQEPAEARAKVLREDRVAGINGVFCCVVAWPKIRFQTLVFLDASGRSCGIVRARTQPVACRKCEKSG
jgi:hypothetical protein